MSCRFLVFICFANCYCFNQIKILFLLRIPQSSLLFSFPPFSLWFHFPPCSLHSARCWFICISLYYEYLLLLASIYFGYLIVARCPTCWFEVNVSGEVKEELPGSVCGATDSHRNCAGTAIRTMNGRSHSPQHCQLKTVGCSCLQLSNFILWLKQKFSMLFSIFNFIKSTFLIWLRKCHSIV